MAGHIPAGIEVTVAEIPFIACTTCIGHEENCFTRAHRIGTHGKVGAYRRIHGNCLVSAVAASVGRNGHQLHVEVLDGGGYVLESMHRIQRHIVDHAVVLKIPFVGRCPDGRVGEVHRQIGTAGVLVHTKDGFRVVVHHHHGILSDTSLVIGHRIVQCICTCHHAAEHRCLCVVAAQGSYLTAPLVLHVVTRSTARIPVKLQSGSASADLDGIQFPVDRGDACHRIGVHGNHHNLRIAEATHAAHRCHRIRGCLQSAGIVGKHIQYGNGSCFRCSSGHTAGIDRLGPAEGHTRHTIVDAQTEVGGRA